ncbi:MAG: dockerin type I domain-containing protein [Phycisphaerae bacterium]
MARYRMVLCILALLLPAVALADVPLQWTQHEPQADGEIRYTVTNTSTAEDPYYLKELLIPLAQHQGWVQIQHPSGMWIPEEVLEDLDGDGVADAGFLLKAGRGPGSEIRPGGYLEWYAYTDSSHRDERPVLCTMRDAYGKVITMEMDVLLPSDSAPAVVLAGDADGDGEVTFNDAWILLSNFPTETGATWEQGDFDGDGDVDAEDAAILKQNYSSELPPRLEQAVSSLPEPCSLMVLSIGGLAALRRRR